jgi:hypothetical protein
MPLAHDLFDDYPTCLVLHSIKLLINIRSSILRVRRCHFAFPIGAGAEREWSDSPLQAEGPGLSLTFPAERNDAEWTLRLRQQDVKQTWNVLLNGQQLARLQPDENDTVLYLPVPAGRLLAGENKLAIQQVG